MKIKLIDALIKYLVVTIIISVILFPKFPFLKIPETFVSVRLEDFILAITGLVIAIKLFPRIKHLIKNELIKTIMIFLSVGLIAVISGILITKTVIPHIGLLHWLRRIEYLIPLFLGIIAIRTDKNNLGFYIRTLVFVLIIVFLYGVGQKYFNFPIIITQNQEYAKGVALRYVPGGHINSTFAGHYDLGTFLVLILPILVSAFFVLKSKVNKIFVFTGVTFGLWLLVNTASRISLLSYFISVTLALILMNRKKLIPLVIIFSLLFTFFSDNLIARYKRIYEVSVQKMEEIISYSIFEQTVFASDETILPIKKINIATPTPTPVFEDRSTNIRLNVEWPRAIRSFYKNPIIGTGYSSNTLATDNDYLRLLGEIGILGFLSFMAILIQLVLVFVDKFPIHKNFSGLELSLFSGMAAAIPGILLNAVFIDVFEASKFAIMFWLMVGMAIGLTKKYEL